MRFKTLLGREWNKCREKGRKSLKSTLKLKIGGVFVLLLGGMSYVCVYAYRGRDKEGRNAELNLRGFLCVVGRF